MDSNTHTTRQKPNKQDMKYILRSKQYQVVERD